MDYTCFEYSRSTPVCYQGIQLDSILELKFLLSIEETHAYIRDGIEIYYEERSLTANDEMYERTRKYVPDFLIRDWKTKQATLVEVKPDRYVDDGLLAEKKKAASHFIETFGYDWQYKVVFEASIHLSTEQYRKLSSILSGQTKHHRQCQPISSYIQEEQHRLFVRSGLVPAPSL